MSQPWKTPSRHPLFLVAVAFAASSAAAMDFERVIGGPDDDRGVCVSATQDGGYVAVGATKSFGEGDEDVYLVRVASTGAVMWARTYGGAEEDNGWSVHEIPSGFVVAGFTRSLGAGGFDFYLIKTAPNGDVVWSRTFGGPGDDRCWALDPAPDGGFLLVGETTSTGRGGEDFLMVRTDSLGQELWSRTFGGDKGDRCFSVARDTDGSYMLAGQTYSEGAGDRDVFVVRTSPEGELQWSRTFGGPASDVGHSITRSSDGHFVVTGYTTSFATPEDDPYLIKIDARGSTVWTRVLAMEGMNHTLTGDQAADGGYFLVGFSVFRQDSTNAALLIKTDAEGTLEWHRNVLPTRTGRSLGYTVRATPDGGCIFTGHTTAKSAGRLDLLLSRIRDPGGGG